MTYYPGTDRPHSIRRNGQMFYYQTDALGSVTGLVNSSNQLVNRYQYTPWGELETGESKYATYDPLGFTARERDDETRLYYYRARYYDPQLGRFISEDPIGLAGGPNVYAYVNNNPINNTDPTGLWCAAGPVYSATCGMCELGWRRVDGVCQSDRGRGYGDIARTGPGDDVGGGAGGSGSGGAGTGASAAAAASAPPNPICWLSAKLAGKVPGAYYGVTANYFTIAGVTGGAGIYWDSGGPGFYLRGGFGVGAQISAGVERGVVLGSMSGAAIEGEVYSWGKTVSASVGIPIGGATGSGSRGSSTRGSELGLLPVGGHVAATYTGTWSMCNRSA